MVVHIGNVVVRGGGLCAGSEKAALGLTVVEFRCEIVCGGGVTGLGVGEEGGDEGGATDREAEETDAGSEFWLCGAFASEVGDGGFEISSVGQGEE